ncbi:recombinase family protein [Streptomyces glaucus]|uniref:recombinase family protein n=1 Tax=Streptomyces glaucus TaxID=284029 RepID=UPI0031D04C59
MCEDSGPSRALSTPPPAPVDPALPSADIRIGYARCSPLGQELDSQLDALAGHGIPRDKIFAEKISTRIRVRPKFEEVLRTAREVKAHAPHCRVIFTAYEMKRLGRDAAELTALADHLTAHGLVLEMLAGPLPGAYGPTGPGKLLFAFFAAMAETERENIRESTLEGLDTAARKGKHGGRPPVITADMLHTVLRRRAGGESVEQIQPDLIIPTGKRKGHNPSAASIYRALAEHAKREAYPEAAEQAHADFAASRTATVPEPRPDTPDRASLRSQRATCHFAAASGGQDREPQPRAMINLSATSCTATTRTRVTSTATRRTALAAAGAGYAKTPGETPDPGAGGEGKHRAGEHCDCQRPGAAVHVQGLPPTCSRCRRIRPRKRGKAITTGLFRLAGDGRGSPVESA